MNTPPNSLAQFTKRVVLKYTTEMAPLSGLQPVQRLCFGFRDSVNVVRFHIQYPVSLFLCWLVNSCLRSQGKVTIFNLSCLKGKCKRQVALIYVFRFEFKSHNLIAVCETMQRLQWPRFGGPWKRNIQSTLDRNPPPPSSNISVLLQTETLIHKTKMALRQFL